MSNDCETNRIRASRIVQLILEVDYNGNLATLQDELGYIVGVEEDIFFWLEDGNCDGLTDEQCRLAYELA